MFSVNLFDDTVGEVPLTCPSAQLWRGDHGDELEIWQAERRV